PNTVAHILDAERRPVADGYPGELYMGGPGMARGYLNRPELTSERFVVNSFGGAAPKLFKTGDLCQRLPDGDLQYLGRMDDQIKIHGCRVEPAEIEAALRSNPCIKEAFAGARTVSNGEQQLVAWVSLVEPGLASATDVRKSLEEALPSYSVPSEI